MKFLMMKTECEWMGYLKINTSYPTPPVKYERDQRFDNYVLHNIKICDNLTGKGRWLFCMINSGESY